MQPDLISHSRRAPGLVVGEEPLVSVCIPTYNGARFIDAALASVAAQDYERIEVVAVDDGSRDGTADRLRAWDARPLRLFVHRRNRGHTRTWNETVARSRGTLIKFLHQDDELCSDCVTRMVCALEGAPAAGLVFSRRHIAFEDVPAQQAREWLAVAGRLDRRFGDLAAVNHGPELLRRWAEAGFYENWIGEPSAVMVRRDSLACVGTFGPYVAQATDMELWARIMSRYDVCFIDDELAVFRVGTRSLSVRNRATRRGWLDRLWILESLAYDDAIARSLPQIEPLLGAERRQAFRSALRLGRVRDGSPVPVAPYLDYLRFRLLARLRPSHAPFGRL